MARLSKAHGCKTITASGRGVLFCRMYHSFRDIWYGLNKNFYGLTGKNIFTLAFFTLIMVMAFLVPYGLLWYYPENLLTYLTLSMMLLLRFALAFRYHHHILISIIFLPITILIGIIIGLNSFYLSNWGTIYWKDRRINLN